jgi:hypothetical protein
MAPVPTGAGYLDGVLCWFVGTAGSYARWLAAHPDEMVVMYDRRLKLADLPLRSEGSADLRGVEAGHRVLHHAWCETIREPRDDGQMICGPRAEIESDFRDEDVQRCPRCVRRTPP